MTSTDPQPDATTLAQVLTALSEFVLLVDPEGRITYLNRAEPGYQPADFVGRRAHELGPLESQAVFEDALAEMVATGELPEYDVRVELDDGFEAWYRIRMRPFPDAEDMSHALLVATLSRRGVRTAEAEERTTRRDEMFAGHLGVALAAKTAEPRAPLGVLVGAAYGVDLLWPVFVLAGVESVAVQPGATAFTPLAFEHYPWTHSLAMTVLWALLAGGALRLAGWSGRVAALVGAVVLSHWFLDAVVHAPDLPLWPGGLEVGFGLWNSVAGTLAVEGLFLGVALTLYLRRFPAADRLGRVGLWALVTVVTLIWVSGPLSPPPPGPRAVAAAGLALWILPFWAWRIEVHRRDRTSPTVVSGEG